MRVLLVLGKQTLVEKPSPLCYNPSHDCYIFPISQESGEKIESMSKKDAAMFPLIASGALFGLYVFFKVCILQYQ